MKLAMLAGCVLAGVAMGQPVQWRVQDGGNGHWYQSVVRGGNITWTTSRNEAQAVGGDDVIALFDRWDRGC